jgi:hypothetical protein
MQSTKLIKCLFLFIQWKEARILDDERGAIVRSPDPNGQLHQEFALLYIVELTFHFAVVNNTVSVIDVFVTVVSTMVTGRRGKTPAGAGYTLHSWIILTMMGIIVPYS